MAGLTSFKKAQAPTSPDDSDSIDPGCLRSFYATSDDIVDDHFSQALLDDLHSLRANPPAEDEWGW